MDVKIKINGAEFESFDLSDLANIDERLDKGPPMTKITTFYKQLPPDARVQVIQRMRCSNSKVIALNISFQIDSEASIEKAARWLYEKTMSHQSNWSLFIGEQHLPIDKTEIQGQFDRFWNTH